MHDSSFNHMRAAVDRHLAGRDRLRVADIGSYNVNGCYRPLFERPGWTYIGVDQSAGPNVDVVPDTPYALPFGDGELDVIVSGQALEHVPFFWLLFPELARCLAPGGLVLMIAPSKGYEHRYPVDCWRFYPDGYRALADWSGLRLVEVHTDLDDPDSVWGDTVGVFQKPDPWVPGDPAVRRVEELAAELDRIARERDRLSGEVERVALERDRMLRSTSWRMTAPLRHAVDWARRVMPARP